MKFQDHIRQVQNIEARLERLLGNYYDLKTKLEALELENERLNKELIQKDLEIKNFQNQDNIAKIVNIIADESANLTDLKLKINEYIREIDKCIAYLKI